MANGGIIGPTQTVTAAIPETITSVTSSGTHTVQPTTTKANILVVAGGGGGGGTTPGGSGSGGGGAGGLRNLSCISVSSPFPVTIGGGGSGSSTGNGSTGAVSTFVIACTTYTASGGGYGAVYSMGYHSTVNLIHGTGAFSASSGTSSSSNVYKSNGIN